MQLSTDRADSQSQPGCGGVIFIPTLTREVINGLSTQRDFSAAHSLALQPHLMSLRAVPAVCCSFTYELKQFLPQTVPVFELWQERVAVLAQRLQILPPNTLLLDSLDAAKLSFTYNQWSQHPNCFGLWWYWSCYRSEARNDGLALLFLMEYFPCVKSLLLPEEQKRFSFKCTFSVCGCVLFFSTWQLVVCHFLDSELFTEILRCWQSGSNLVITCKRKSTPLEFSCLCSSH